MSFSIVEGPLKAGGRWREYEIYKEGWGKVETLLGNRQDAERAVERLQTEEVQAHRAYDDPDPRAPCRLGWHRGIDRTGRGAYFFRLRAGWGGCSLAYLVSRFPIEHTGRTIGSFNANANPWRCVACSQEIGERYPQDQSLADRDQTEPPGGEDWQL